MKRCKLKGHSWKVVQGRWNGKRWSKVDCWPSMVMKLWHWNGREELARINLWFSKTVSTTHQTRSTIMTNLWHDLSKGGWCHFRDQRWRNLKCVSFDEIGVHPKMMLVERNWHNMQQAYGIEAKLNHTIMSGFIHFCQSHDATRNLSCWLQQENLHGSWALERNLEAPYV